MQPFVESISSGKGGYLQSSSRTLRTRTGGDLLFAWLGADLSPMTATSKFTCQILGQADGVNKAARIYDRQQRSD